MDKDLINRHIEKSMGVPFVWGTSDCCTFVFDALREALGRDPMGALRDSYSTAAGAAKVTGGRFVETVIAMAAEQGFPPCYHPFGTAAFGIVATQRGPAMALYLDGKWILRSHGGVVAVGFAEAVLAWELPHA